MKVALELKIFFSAAKSLLGLTSIFRGRLPVRPVLALLHICANGNNECLSVILTYTSAKGLCVSASLNKAHPRVQSNFSFQTRHL